MNRWYDTIVRGIALSCATFCVGVRADDPDPSGGKPTAPPTGRRIVIAVGHPGSDEYRESFGTWARRWEEAARKGEVACTVLGLDEEREGASDRDRLAEAVAESRDDAELWIVLIGHGTFDGRSAKFNLRGRDVSATELNEWLDSHRGTVAIVNSASASGPFVNRLSGPNRVVVTATKSGSEHFYARFGDHLSATIGDPTRDLDKDGQTSLFEAWLFACRRTAAFYADEGRLATEHGLLDDNGDGRGTRAEVFEGLEPVRSADAGEIDGLRARTLHLVRSDRESRLTEEQRRRRDDLERQLADLRDRSDEWTEEEYLNRIEPLLLELATIYESTNDRRR